MERMRISQLAERSGVPVTTLRFYEGAGLVPAERSESGYRLYGEQAVERLEFIGAAKHLGLPLEEIAELLGVWERGACAEVKADLRPRLVARLGEAEIRRAEVEAFVRELRGALARLDALPDRAERCGPDCGIPAARELARRPEPRAVVDDPVVACSLTSGEFRERAAQWRRILSGAQRRVIDRGVEVSVPADRAGQLAVLCVAEQECCPFFEFALRLDGASARLEVRAPDSARELVEQLTA